MGEYSLAVSLPGGAASRRDRATRVGELRLRFLSSRGGPFCGQVCLGAFGEEPKIEQKDLRTLSHRQLL